MQTSPDRLLELARYSGDPWVPENDYFARAETFMDSGWDQFVWPLIEGCDFRSVIDLACGHGRNSRKLGEHAGRILMLDIQPGNIAKCRKRFGDDPRYSFAVNNGYDLRPAADASATLVYCFDAMVHFDGDVIRSYLRDTLRVLVPGGHAFLHHSNYTGGDDWRSNPASRNFMSAAFFAHYARKEGLVVLRQQVINWGGHAELDCLTLLQRP
ncbi:MAG: class I SAM-dependent methyltransferase [Panacagrimonas sp.]